MDQPAHPLLEVESLSIEFVAESGPPNRVVEGASFRLERGETLAIVGESGSGKSVTALALTRLLPEPPARIVGGRILLDGDDVLAMNQAQLRSIRGGRIAYVFQEPGSSLNPVFTIRSQIAEAIRLHRPDVTDSDREVAHWLYQVGIVDPEKRMHDYPHQLSGGMQQRAMIAMALSCRPDILVADEPTTALDVTTQAQIIDLLARLKRELGMAIILITHNFGIISGIADKVAVMFRGRVVEQGATADVLHKPSHPYTRALIDCIPKLGDKRERLTTINYDQLSDFAASSANGI